MNRSWWQQRHIDRWRLVLRVFTLAACTVLTACASLPEDPDLPVSVALQHTDETALGRFAQNSLDDRPEESAFLLLRQGLDAFAARTELAMRAEVSIDAQYFLLQSDLTGALFVQSLLEAADRGVRVRLLVDDWERVFVGSLNLDPRSLVQNTELGVVVESPDMARILADGFDANLDRVAFRLELERDESGVERITWHGRIGDQAATFSVDPYTSAGRRAGIGILSLLPIESQL